MDNITDLFHDMAREGDRTRNKPMNTIDYIQEGKQSKEDDSPPIDFATRIENLKVAVKRKQMYEWERDELIRVLATLYGIDESEFPNFLK